MANTSLASRLNLKQLSSSSSRFLLRWGADKGVAFMKRSSSNVARSTGRCSQHITGSIYTEKISDMEMQDALDPVHDLIRKERRQPARNKRNDSAMNGDASSVIPSTRALIRVPRRAHGHRGHSCRQDERRRAYRSQFELKTCKNRGRMG